MTAVPTSPPAPGSWAARLRDLDRDGDTFTAAQPEGPMGRLFGGLVAAHALAAACETIDVEKLPQSLHAYFVRGGRPGIDVHLEVARIRDGRSFDTRRVTATQEGATIFEMLASFHRPEPGIDDHPPGPAMEAIEATTPLPVPGDLAAKFEMRTPDRSTVTFVGPPYWIRSREPVDDDPITRACALTFISDIALMAAARPPGTPLRFDGVFAASLDHTLWFHRPFDPNRWHRYEAGSVNNHDSRGLALGGLYDDSGSLIATLAQEALWRL